MFNSLTLKTLAMLAVFAAGLFMGYDYSANEYTAEIATLEKTHATDLADQVSMGAEMLADSLAIKAKREASYRQALVVLTAKNQTNQTKLQSNINQLIKAGQSHEEIKRVGNMHTPDWVVDWLQ